MNAAPELDRRILDDRVARVTHAMAAHGGGIELVDVDSRGAARVRFTGLCAGCQLRPLTLAETIEPALLSVPGITAVAADGARISAEAMARIRHYSQIDPIQSIDLPYTG